MKAEHTPVAWKVGDYAMKRDFVVRIESETANGRFGVEYVSHYRQGAGVTCGGYSSSWAPDELTPIVEPAHLILVRAYEAQRRIRAAEREIAEQTKVLDAHRAALLAHEDAIAAITKAKAQ